VGDDRDATSSGKSDGYLQERLQGGFMGGSMRILERSFHREA